MTAHADLVDIGMDLRAAADLQDRCFGELVAQLAGARRHAAAAGAPPDLLGVLRRTQDQVRALSTSVSTVRELAGVLTSTGQQASKKAGPSPTRVEAFARLLRPHLAVVMGRRHGDRDQAELQIRRLVDEHPDFAGRASLRGQLGVGPYTALITTAPQVAVVGSREARR